ncbi:Lrp/AsnC ligand binding domain-containing protein [Acinetobacter sp. B5B]|uniref:Lrp/AsnC family transcriptional regulator n=1 Tax=Acinetobacter baretiae TaxID=2605383 RepID=UPI0018C2555F|nr:Lrp/AsnC ligand binding domain-containing protein [Acinetobacter baretiae]MBF7683575.1 Lrp/AsnC ligand binding domain-containing protein [Acinetobacter baretiae]MBF7686351.1 Lrp/AsnC ligand binding domain-containing protein [Acinetobacter baretiae]
MSKNTEHALTATDLKMMRALQKNGRLSNTELAKHVGMSTTACWKHTQRLFKIGAIRKIQAMIAPNMVEKETIVLVGIVLDRSTPESFAAFEHVSHQLDAVLECYLVAGEVDYFLKVRVKDLAAFNDFHRDQIISLPGVRQVRTFFVLNEVKTDGILVF